MPAATGIIPVSFCSQRFHHVTAALLLQAGGDDLHSPVRSGSPGSDLAVSPGYHRASWPWSGWSPAISDPERPEATSLPFLAIVNTVFLESKTNLLSYHTFQGRGEIWGLLDPRSLHEDLPCLIFTTMDIYFCDRHKSDYKK